MTDRDESSEGFLARWSRKKIDAEKKAPDEPRPDDSTRIGSSRRAAEDGQAATTKADKPEFDPPSLPSLESITAGTDIRAFLTPDVPAGVARAALRRAWATDPTIRDFVGLAENAWDFTDPAAMPGFGPMEPDLGLKRVAAKTLGQVEDLSSNASTVQAPSDAQTSRLPEERAEELSAQAEPAAAADKVSDMPSSSAHGSQPLKRDLLQCENFSVSNEDDSQSMASKHKPRRNHGGALPQ